jgi:hypothetical protein
MMSQKLSELGPAKMAHAHIRHEAEAVRPFPGGSLREPRVFRRPQLLREAPDRFEVRAADGQVAAGEFGRHPFRATGRVLRKLEQVVARGDRMVWEKVEHRPARHPSASLERGARRFHPPRLRDAVRIQKEEELTSSRASTEVSRGTGP